MNVARLYLWLQVDDVSAWYSVVPLDSHQDVAVRAWRVKKIGSDAVYDVSICPRGYLACTCADGVYRSNGACKHAKALKAMGMMT